MLNEVEAMPIRRLMVSDCVPVIVALKDKGYSFVEIAAYLSKKIGNPVKRGNVYRVYRDHLAEEEMREANHEPDEMEED